jgi:integrase/recombinase XerD
VGIDRHITIHDLRHTFATLCVQAGVDIRQLQEMLGHSTITKTVRCMLWSNPFGGGAD